MSFKPSGEEQKWAKQQEIDVRKKLKEFLAGEKHVDLIGIDSTCPADGRSLEGIEIDDTGIYIYKCSFCGGIWINRSELEQLFQSPQKTNKLIKYLAGIFNIQI